MATKKNILIENKFWAIILVAQFSLFYVLSKVSLTIQFFSDFFEWKKNLHIALFSNLDFSVGDVFYIITILLVLFSIVKLILRKKSSLLKPLLLFLNLFYLVYQMFWGMLYFQSPIISKLEKRTLTEQQLKILTRKYLALCRQTRENVSESRKGIFVIQDVDQIKREIILQQAKIPAAISNKKPIKKLSVKESLFGYTMNYSGILGYYNPFTAEAQYNPNLPSTQIPFTLAHEMSHQLGFAREQEASFVAYLCAKNSANQDLKYSTQLYVLKSLLRALAVQDKKFVKQILAGYSDKMKRDRNDELQFFAKHEGIVSDLFGISNDLFLKSNQQDGSVSYSYFVTLLALYEA